MKMSVLRKGCVVFSAALVLASGNLITAQAAAPYDDFESDRLDTRKWQYLDKGTYVQNGKLQLEYRTSGIDYDLIDLRPVAPDTLFGMQAKVKIDPKSLQYLASDGSDRFQVGLFGSFYETTEQGGGTVYISAYLEVSDPSASTAHFVYSVDIQQGDTWTTFSGTDNSLQNTTVPIDNEVTIRMYRLGLSDNGISFGIDPESDGSFLPVTFDGPTISSEITGSQKAVELVIDNGSFPPVGDKYAFASVDDVAFQTSGNGPWDLYDDFTAPRIDASKWIQQQDPPKNFTRHGIENGKMFFTAQADGTPTHTRTRIDNRLPESEFTNYFQADITLDPSTSVTGTDTPTEDNEARVMFFGYIFNDTFANPSTDEGGVYPGVHIRERAGGSTQAFASVYRCNDAFCSTGTDHFYQPFDCTVTPGSANTVSIEKTGSTFTFSCDDSVKIYNHTGNMYDHMYDFRRIRADARASNGESTDIKVYVDNVYTVKPSSSFLLNVLPAIVGNKNKE